MNKNFNDASFKNLNSNSNINVNNKGKVKNSSTSVKEKMIHLISVYDNEPKNEDNIEIKQIEHEKQKNAVERCFLLYEKGKIKNEVNRLMYRKNSELKVKQELDSCTFKPKLNTNYRQIVNQNQMYVGTHNNAYNRSIYWKGRRIEK